MKVIKKILLYLVEPFNEFGSRGFSEKTSKYVRENNFIIYLVAFLLTIIIIGITYFI